MFIRISATKSININHIVCASTVQYSNFNKLSINIELTTGKSLLIEPDYITAPIKEVLNLHF